MTIMIFIEFFIIHKQTVLKSEYSFAQECRWFSLKELRDHIRKVVSTRRKGIPIKDEFYFARLVLLYVSLYYNY